jgi:HAE1 family hydrophobic/amphiphilic exporter-1
MRLSDTAIRNPVFAWMLMFGLMIFGGICFSRMGVSQLPDADFPVVSVSMNLEGAAPEVMETTVVDPIEDALTSIQGVRSITSSAKQGSATVTVEFDLGKDIDVSVQEIQTKVAQAQRFLPKEVDPPTISKTNPDDQPIMWLAVTSKKGSTRELMIFVRDFLKDKFTTVAGVGDIFLGGYVEPNLRVWVKPSEARKFNISVSDIIDAIKSEHSELPGGQIETETKTFNVRTMGEAKTSEEFGEIAINKRAGAYTQDPFNIIRLRQVADVEEGLADIQKIARFNGELSVGVGIRKQKGSNAVEVAKAVKKKVAELKGTLPEGYDINVNFDTTRFIADSIHELNFTLILSALLTAFACWVFLGSWTATLNVVLSIPTSILGAFIPMYFMGFTLNTFTLLGLSLAIGIVVDDAIMVLENIFRHNEKGLTRVQAAIVGAREITFAAMAATIAVVAIFLPVAFMKGVIGKFFFQFGVTITVAVLFSLIEALTITPMRCATFVEMGERKTRLGRAFENAMEQARIYYEKSLSWCLIHRWKTLGAAFAIMLASFISVKFLAKEFSPAQDQGIFLVRFQTPVGSSLQYTDSKVKKAEDFFRSREEVKQFYVSVGGFGSGSSDGNSAMMFITMKDPKDRPKDPGTGRYLTQQDFMGVVRKGLLEIGDVKPIIQDLSLRGFTASRGFPVEFNVLGPNWDELAKYSNQIMKEMEKSGLMVDVDTNYLLGMPEVQITPDRKQAAFHGISIQTIGTTVNALIGGVKVGQYPKDGKRYDVRVQIRKEYDKVDEIKNLLVGNPRGNLIPLSSVVTQEVKQSLQQISRIDRQRAISVYSNVAKNSNQESAVAKAQEIAKNILPEGYSVMFSGSAQTFKESFQGLIFALILGLLVAYMVLASQFNSFIDPISVLLALPFSISGAFLALAIFGQSLNIYSMIGLILLMGIVKKNSILLVEFTNHVRNEGEADVYKALIKACPIRLRPILMTSFATIVGAIPPALAIGPGAETRGPMAIAIIGGVMMSTLLTLYVVPCAYSLMDRLQKRSATSQETKAAFVHVGTMGEA